MGAAFIARKPDVCGVVGKTFILIAAACPAFIGFTLGFIGGPGPRKAIYRNSGG